MIRKIFTAVLSLALFAGAVFPFGAVRAQAPTLEDLQSQILTLQGLISQLQSQLTAIQQNSSSSASSSSQSSGLPPFILIPASTSNSTTTSTSTNSSAGSVSLVTTTTMEDIASALDDSLIQPATSTTYIMSLNDIVPTGFTFTRDLKIGDTGDDVLILQKILNLDPETRITGIGAGTPGQETTYYGAKTAAAVKLYQTKYSKQLILPLAEVLTAGSIGPTSRGMLNAQIAHGSITISTINVPGLANFPQPVITSLTPKSGKPGTTITIHGTGFTPTNNRIYTGFSIVNGVASPDGKTLVFRIKAFWAGQKFWQTTHIMVENAGGMSNEKSFQILL